MSARIWSVELGEGPLVATAVHDGHEMRNELLEYVALDESDRLREEDPFTGRWTGVAPTRIVGLRSRFEVDLNRPRARAVYRGPEDAWGLLVWKDGGLPEDIACRSLAEHEAFYRELYKLYGGLAARYGKFVVFDLHTYNHRRDGPDGPDADPLWNPQVNVGTGTMRNRERFGPVIDRFIGELASQDFPGGPLDVRENVKFQGGYHPLWAHDRFPDAACVLAVEFKKFFMDEWTGERDETLEPAIQRALQAVVPGVLETLASL